MRARTFAYLCCFGAVALGAPATKACGETEDWLTPDEIVALKAGKPLPFRQMERFYFVGLEPVAIVDPWIVPDATASPVELKDIRPMMLAMAQAPLEFETLPLSHDHVEVAPLDPFARQARDQKLTRVTVACSGRVLIHPSNL